MYGEIERQRVTTRRTALLIGGKLLIASILAGRMYQLQVVRSERYKLQADGNRVRIRPLAPARGRILDRFGAALAVNRETFRVLLIPERAVDTARTLDTLDRLIDLTDDEKTDALRQAARRKAFTPIAIRRGLDWHQVARIEVNAPDLPGVVIDVGQIREYPHSVGTAHVLGYVGAASGAEAANSPLLALPGFRVGKAGIEKTRDSMLRGTPGTRQVEVNAFGREVRDLSIWESRPGGDLRLTLDIALQDFTVARLARQQAAAAVLMGVAAGDVLAMASTPGFEPNQFSEGIRAGVWKSVNSDPLSPMLNRAISGRYAPGSTFKMVVALAALEAGAAAPGRRVECRGFTELGKTRFHCWRRRGHGWVDMVEAIARSCDVYFYDLAARTGIDRIAAMARRLGLGARLLGELPGETAGLVPTPGWKEKRRGARWHRGDTLNVGIGQGAVLATPLQLAVMTARLASGRSVVPRLTLDGPEPDFPPLGLSDAGLRTIRRGMEAVANAQRGTAFRHVAREEGFVLAGKTGTSQVRRTTRRERETGMLENHERPWRERDHALFVAYAPLTAPRYAVTVVVEHGGGGSAVAAPIASDILREALRRDPLAEDAADGPAFAGLGGGRG